MITNDYLKSKGFVYQENVKWVKKTQKGTITLEPNGDGYIPYIALDGWNIEGFMNARHAPGIPCVMITEPKQLDDFLQIALKFMEYISYDR